ncbi:unnamed protein product, partial [Rotaria sp. Silwood2]
CEEDGLRHSNTADKVKRVSQAKLDIIAECQLNAPKPYEHKVREPLETHTEPLAPFFVEIPENTSAKEGQSTFVDIAVDGQIFPIITEYKGKVEIAKDV